MKKLVLFVFLISISNSQDKYSQVRILLSPEITIHKLASLGFAVDHISGKKNNYIDVFVNSYEISQLKKIGIPFLNLIEDWDSHFAQQQKAELLKPEINIKSLSGIIKNFRYGSMGGFLTLQELTAEFDSMRTYYPNIISKNDTIGFSIQNKPIIAVKISKNPLVNENEPRALYNSLIHAREPEGMMQMIYFMWYLLENYGTDEEVTNILDTRELYFIPCLNPDGYFYNQTTNLTGGGMWRKNRRLNSGTIFGVDLNRNFGYNWGFDDIGSSPNTNSSTYRGTSGFSEPETQAIRNFCNLKNFSIAMNIHTYSNLLIYPWGYNDVDTKDSILYRSLAEELIEDNRYSYGTGLQTVGYTVNGDADDWMYGDTISKSKIFSYTPEIGNHVDLFWPKKERILPLCLENLSMNLKVAHAAGEFIQVKLNSIKDSANTTSVSFSLINKGVVNKSASFKVRIKNNSSMIFLKDTIFSNLSLNTKYTLQFPKYNFFNTPGAMAKLFFKIEGSNVFSYDTINFRIGKPNYIFTDSTETGISKWVATGSWGATSEKKLSGNFSFTDSPTGPSLNNSSSSLTLKDYVNLKNVNQSFIGAAELRFSAKWNIESCYDFLRVQASSDSGKTWKDLSGIHTQPANGTGKQIPVFTPGYDAVKHDWSEEIIDLSYFVRNPAVKIRFLMETDEYEVFDGWYMDNISISVYLLDINSVRNDNIPNNFELYQNFPNPWNPSTTINFKLPIKSNIKLKLFDILGREIKTITNGEFIAGTHSVILNGRELSSGIYFVRLETPDNFLTIKTFLSK